MSTAPTALLYDVHGNLPALEAVIADARAQGAKTFLLGGDYALFGAFPAETLELLGGLDATWIRGNTDRWVAGVDADDAPDRPLVKRAINFCREQLGGKHSGELGELVETASREGVLFCHASPRSDMDSFLPEPMDSDPQLLSGVAERAVVFGHTHLQFQRKTGACELVNPGSVGLPFDKDTRAAYALWRGGDTFEARRVAYDVAGYAAQLKDRMSVALGDSVETMVARVEQADFIAD